MIEDQVAAVEDGDLLRQWQPQTRAGILQREEWLENPGLQVVGNPAPRIGKSNPELLPVSGARLA